MREAHLLYFCIALIKQKGIDTMQVLSDDNSNKLANLSFLCAIFVVLIHIWSPTPVGSVAWWLYAMTSMRNIAVPSFFLMSGFFLAGHIGESDWWKNEKKRIKSLLVPYVVWSALWLLFLLARQLLDNVLQNQWLFCGTRTIINAHSVLGFDLFRHPQLATLWYVRSLIIFVFISPLLMWALKKNLWLVLSLAAIKTALYRGEASGTCFYLVDRMFSFGFIFYFLLGMAIRKDMIPIPRKNYTVSVGIVAVVFWLFMKVTCVAGGNEPLPRIVRFALGRLDTINTMLWMYFIWMIIPAKKLPQVFVNTSFAIYLVHWFVLVGLWQHYVSREPHNVAELLLAIIIGVGGTVLVVVFMKKFMPRISAFLFGGR